MQKCQNSCPKIKQKQGKSEASALSYTGQTEDQNGGSKSTINSHRSRTYSQKSVHIGGVTAVDDRDSRITRTSDKATNSVDRDHGKDSYSSKSNSGFTKSSPQSTKDEHDSIRATKSHDQAEEKSGTRSTPRRESPRTSGQTKSYDRMSSKSGNSTGNAEWDSTRHDPCPSSCAMTKKRESIDLSTRKAELRQERLDDYLLNKGFSYFDDLCTCSSLCLINQLRRDKFVVDMLKSACLFGLGMKLCEELDAWNIIG